MTEKTSTSHKPVSRPWTLRRIHRTVAAIAAPFIIISAIGGGTLLLRVAGIYDRRGDFRSTVQRIHNYEVIARYIGLIAVVFMLAAAITGLMLLARTHRRNK